MKIVTIYTTSYSPYCVKAKNLLNHNKIDFEEINAEDDKNRNDMISLSGGKKTVPQIFINGISIGGCDDLYDLDKKGKLETMINS